MKKVERLCGTEFAPAEPSRHCTPVQLSEADAAEAINALIVRGFVGLVYKPYLHFVATFFVRPGPYQSEQLKKAAVKDPADANE